jgi:hypothetical protein
MKTTTIALAALLAGFAASAARAGSQVYVGVNTGPLYRPEAPVYRTTAPAVIVQGAIPYYAAPAPRGYWKDVTVKTWIPERWSMGRNQWGRPVRVFEPGHFAYATNRVWVDGRHDRNDHWNNSSNWRRNDGRR